MPRTIAEKLQIKPGTEVLFAGSTEQRALLDPLPAGVTVAEGIHRDTADVAVAFTADAAALDAFLTGPAMLLTTPRAVWIAYPKGGRADINRDSIWTRVEEVGWTLNANISLGDTWSAVRMKRA